MYGRIFFCLLSERKGTALKNEYLIQNLEPFWIYIVKPHGRRKTCNGFAVGSRSAGRLRTFNARVEILRTAIILRTSAARHQDTDIQGENLEVKMDGCISCGRYIGVYIVPGGSNNVPTWRGIWIYPNVQTSPPWPDRWPGLCSWRCDPLPARPDN